MIHNLFAKSGNFLPFPGPCRFGIGAPRDEHAKFQIIYKTPTVHLWRHSFFSTPDNIHCFPEKTAEKSIAIL
jgi:hypothetical protein